MQNPKFSIIIPMYNVEKFIARAMQSAINQSYKNIEIICVDDCGNDKSAKIAKEFALSDSRIKILQNDVNLGTFATRNKGALSAKGEYLLFLDSDDYLHNDTCQKCYEILENANKGGGQKIDFISFNLFTQPKQNSNFEPFLYIEKTQIIDDYAFEAMYFCKNTHYFNMATKCVSREIYLNALNLINITRKLNVAEDILASMMILGVSKRIALLQDSLYFYAFNDNSITKNSAKIKERVENLSFVISALYNLATKKDRQYEVFLRGLIKVLEFHIIHNKIQPLILAYKNRIEKGCPKFLARFILSLQKKPLRIKQKECELQRFIKENEIYFKGI